MNPKHDETDGSYRARIPADVDAPDKVLYGLTFRQLAILAVAALFFYFVWNSAHTVVPGPVLLVGGVIVGGLVFGLAVGRRDGLPMDVWLLAAIRHTRSPHAFSTSSVDATVPDWVDVPKQARTALPAPLRFPADAINDDGEVGLGDGWAAVVAATTVNLTLRTSGEQAALVDAFGGWLNSLNSPTQIVVSAQPVDLASHARTLAENARHLPHPALEAAGADHAAFLADLARHRDPLRRQVLVATRTAAGENGEHAARRRADTTARSLSGLGVTTRALDGAAVTAALAAAADPYRPARPGGLAAPTTVITAAPPTNRRRRTR